MEAQHLAEGTWHSSELSALREGDLFHRHGLEQVQNAAERKHQENDAGEAEILPSWSIHYNRPSILPLMSTRGLSLARQRGTSYCT